MWDESGAIKDASDTRFTFLHCPFNLLQLFKAGIYRSKTEIIIDHSSDANLFPTLTSRMAENNVRSASQSILDFLTDFLK